MVECGLGDTYPARIGQGFEPCRDVHTIAVDPLPFLDDVSEIDPDAKLHLPVLRKFHVP